MKRIWASWMARWYVLHTRYPWVWHVTARPWWRLYYGVWDLVNPNNPSRDREGK